MAAFQDHYARLPTVSSAWLQVHSMLLTFKSFSMCRITMRFSSAFKILFLNNSHLSSNSSYLRDRFDFILKAHDRANNSQLELRSRCCAILLVHIK